MIWYTQSHFLSFFFSSYIETFWDISVWMTNRHKTLSVQRTFYQSKNIRITKFPENIVSHFGLTIPNYDVIIALCARWGNGLIEMSIDWLNDRMADWLADWMAGWQCIVSCTRLYICISRCYPERSYYILHHIEMLFMYDSKSAIISRNESSDWCGGLINSSPPSAAYICVNESG